jgi:hypothetical protein
MPSWSVDAVRGDAEAVAILATLSAIAPGVPNRPDRR